MIARVFEIDPLIYPKCGGKLAITAFVIKPEQVENLLHKSNLPLEDWPPTTDLRIGGKHCKPKGGCKKIPDFIPRTSPRTTCPPNSISSTRSEALRRQPAQNLRSFVSEAAEIDDQPPPKQTQRRSFKTQPQISPPKVKNVAVYYCLVFEISYCPC